MKTCPIWVYKIRLAIDCNHIEPKKKQGISLTVNFQGKITR